MRTRIANPQRCGPGLKNRTNMLGDQRSAKKIAIDYPPVQACSLDAQNLSVSLK